MRPEWSGNLSICRYTCANIKKKTQAGDNDKLVGQFVGQGGCLIEYPEILEILILIDAVAEVAAAVVVASVRE